MICLVHKTLKMLTLEEQFLNVYLIEGFVCVWQIRLSNLGAYQSFKINLLHIVIITIWDTNLFFIVQGNLRKIWMMVNVNSPATI